MKIPKINIAKKYLILGGILILGLGFYVYRQASSKPEYQEYTVEKRNLKETLDLSGEVSASSVATLRFGAGGLVTYLGAREGDQIKKWQTLASVDTRQVQKVLEQKLNLYAIQRATFDQTVDDNDNSIPDGDVGRTLKRLLDKNQYQLDNVVKDVEYQSLTLSLSRIYSPIAGILVKAPFTVANVQALPTDTWMVVDPTSLEFVADLDETELHRVSVGQHVDVILDAYPDNVISSTIKSVSYLPKETTTGTTYEVKIALPASEMERLRLGLNGTASVLLQAKEQVPSLESSAISGSGGTTTVKILENGKYVERSVTTGIENDGLVEIVSGLGVGDHVYQEK